MTGKEIILATLRKLVKRTHKSRRCRYCLGVYHKPGYFGGFCSKSCADGFDKEMEWMKRGINHA